MEFLHFDKIKEAIYIMQKLSNADVMTLRTKSFEFDSAISYPDPSIIAFPAVLDSNLPYCNFWLDMMRFSSLQKVSC